LAARNARVSGQSALSVLLQLPLTPVVANPSGGSSLTDFTIGAPRD
jgi:hypothetical protein